MEGVDMGTSAVLPGTSAPVKVETDLFSVVEGGQTFGASQAGPCLIGWPTGV